MANLNESESGNSGAVAFRVPKRNLNINGIDKKNRPFNGRFNRPIKKNEDFENLVKDGILSNVSLGSKNCFFVKELSEENKQKLFDSLDLENKTSQGKYSSTDIADNGWWTIETEVKDGITPCKELETSISTYHSFDDPEDKNCLTMYGETGFSVDFSKFNMISDDEGGIIYPYGILFFSDTKAFVNQFSARCAVVPARLERARNNVYIKQIDGDNWTDARIKGSFRSTGHFVIFYVSKEEADEETKNLFPIVSMITIDTVLNRDKDGSISAIGISKVEKTEESAKSFGEDSFVSEINYLIKKAFAKYSPVSIASSRFVSDYIYLIGDKPQYYDLSCFVSDGNDPSKKNGENFSIKKAVEASEEKATESKNKKNKKSKKNNKKNETVEKEDTPTATDKGSAQKVEDQLITEVSENAIVDETNQQ